VNFLLRPFSDTKLTQTLDYSPGTQPVPDSVPSYADWMEMQICDQTGSGLGIYARASSTDSQWCIAAFAELSDEITKQVPRWPFLRNAAFLYRTYTIMFGITLWYLADTVAVLTIPSHNFAPDVSSTIATTIGWVSPALAFGAVALTQRLIPAFEVVEAGKGSRGRRLMASIGSIVVAVVLAVVGNAVSKAVLGS